MLIDSVLLLLSFLMARFEVESSERKVVCYFFSKTSIQPESLNSTLCTHLNYAFVQVQENGTIVAQETGMYTRVYQMKNTNPTLKLLFSVAASSAAVFSSVVASEEKRKKFIKNCRTLLETYSYDGIDIDWEFPYAPDNENFINLLKELRSELDTNSWLLTIAARPVPTTGYNVPEIDKYVDFINLMCYNYYGGWSAYTGQNSPLYASSIESTYEKNHLNVAVSAKNWLAAGATREKIVIGVPFYGRSFTLKDPENHGLHAPITGAGKVPTPTYSQICKNYNNWTTVWDDEQKNYYKYLGDQWLGYDEERSLTEKGKYIVDENFAGVMVWQIAGDDVLGHCGEPQVLLNLLKTEVNKIYTQWLKDILLTFF